MWVNQLRNPEKNLKIFISFLALHFGVLLLSSNVNKDSKE